MATVAELQEKAEALGLPTSGTKAELLERLAESLGLAEGTAAAPALTERHCPRCGKVHGSSLIPRAELGEYTSGERRALLEDERNAKGEPVARFRVFYCGGGFFVVVHEEEE